MTNLMQFMRSEHKLDVTLQKEDLPAPQRSRIADRQPGHLPVQVPVHARSQDVRHPGGAVGKPAGEPQERRAAPGRRLLRQAGIRPSIPHLRRNGYFRRPSWSRSRRTTRSLARTSTGRRQSRQSACERSGRTATAPEAQFHDSRPTQLEGIKVNGRWAVIYSRYDIGCALEKHASSDCKGYDHDSDPASRRCGGAVRAEEMNLVDKSE